MGDKSNKAVIVFRWLAVTNIPLAILFRILGWRVIFIEPVGCLRDLKWVSVFGNFGIELVNFSSYKNYITDSDIKISAEYAEKILEFIFTDVDYEVLLEHSPALGNDFGKARSIIYEQMVKSLKPYSLAYAIGEHFRSQGLKAAIYQPRSLVNSILRRANVTEIVNYCLIWNLHQLMFRRIFSKLKNISTAKLGRRKTVTSVADTSAAPTSMSSQVGVGKVLYFPHQGLSYGNLYKKDFYYSCDPSSPFYRDNITHCEIGGGLTEQENHALIKGYAENGIAPSILSLKKTAILQFAKKIANVFLMERNTKHSIFKALMISRSILEIEKYVDAFKPYMSAKIALLGYSYHFPNAGVVALQSLGVRVAALQERLIFSFYRDHAPILDLYCSIGETDAQLLKEKPFSNIKKIALTGDPLASLIKGYRKDATVFRKKNYRAYASVCLVLDYHSATDYFENAMLLGADWESNKLFYRTVCKLAEEHLDCLFIIRGKNNNWLKVPEMSATVDLVSSYKNIQIDTDYEQLNRSYYLAAMSDFVVARYSSMCDQCLSVGIPVLIYEPLANGSNVISDYHDFSPYPVLVRSDQELLHRFSKLVKDGTIMSDEKFSNMRSKYYTSNSGDAEGAVSTRIQNELQGLLFS